MNELQPTFNQPKLPLKWDYYESVNKVKGLIFKWKNLTEELFGEFWKAREKLSAQGLRNKSSEVRTWSDYCKDIGYSRQVVNRWLSQWELRKKIKELSPPKGISQVIYADPPWQYSNTGFDQSAEKHYPTISTLDLCKPETWLKLPIKEILQERSVLFLWVTYPFAREGFQICDAWGFQYKAQMVWVKNTTTGMGWFVTPKHELLYIATNGQELHPAIKPESVFSYETDGHSKKPPQIYEMIESMYTGPYIELFARNKRTNWESWGNDAD